MHYQKGALNTRQNSTDEQEMCGRNRKEKQNKKQKSFVVCNSRYFISFKKIC